MHTLFLRRNGFGDDFADAFDGVFCHFEGQFFVYFCHDGLVVSDKFDCVKLTFRRALSATYAHIGVDFRRAASEASCRFGFHLFFGEGRAVVFERAVVFFYVQRALTFDVVVAFEFQIVLIELDENSSVSAVFLGLSRPYRPVQGDCAFFAACDCVDCEFRSRHAVAAGDDILVARNVEFVNRNGVVFVEFDVGAVQQVTPLDFLTD